MRICDKCLNPIPDIHTRYKEWKLTGNIASVDHAAKSYELCAICFQRVIEFTESAWK